MRKNIFLTAVGALACSGALIAQTYSVVECDYDPMATEGTEICLGDDAVSSALPLGFTFNFYGADFTSCYVSSNGYLSFDFGLDNACCTGAVLPNAIYPHSIFFGQEDLDPNTCVDGTISYYTTGAPGSQIFVLSFTDVPHYPGPEGTFPVTVQVQLYEGSNEVHIVTTEYNSDGGASTMGVNGDGTDATWVPGRNSEIWSAFGDCYAFILPDNNVSITDITAPVSGVGLTATESVTVTVFNGGTSDQTDIPVNFTVDGGAVISEIVPGTLAAGASTSYTFAATIDMSAIGCREIDAYTSLIGDEVPGDDHTVETVCNFDEGSIAYYIYSNTTGGEPWFTTNNTTAMNAAFGPEDITWFRDYYETLDVATVFGPATCFVFLEGSDAHANELETFLTANIGTIEAWVNDGGHLLLNAAPNEGDGMSFGFDGTNLVYDGGSGSVTAADPGHPIFNGPFLPCGTDFTGTNFSHAQVTGTDITPLIYETGTTDITLGEKAWGSGRVLFGGMTTDNFHDPDPNAANLRANIFSYMGCTAVAVCEIPGGLFADGITDNDAVLHWNDVDGADQYRVTLQNTFTGLIKTRGFYTNSVELVDKLTPLTTYAFRVKTVCYDDLGVISAPSPWYYFTTLGRIGENANGSVVLYPNPNNGSFNIQLNGLTENTFDVSVYSAIGSLVYNTTVHVTSDAQTQNIALDNAPAGMYQVIISNAENTLKYPVVIER